MTKKEIIEYLTVFIIGLFLVIAFINPISKKYTIWNYIYISKDFYN
jgi:hypothetical protein